MSDQIWVERLAGWIAWNHEELERSVRAANPAVLHVRPSQSAPSIALHAWHAGRWIDRHAYAISSWLDPAATVDEVWIALGVAERWSLTGIDLGDFGGTGAGLDDSASAALPLPDVDAILDYLVAASRSLEGVLGRIEDDAVLERVVVDLYGDETQIGEAILNHLSHADRHLGMIEALRGVIGERGTATI
jgi:hypothetical protein